MAINWDNPSQQRQGNSETVIATFNLASGVGYFDVSTRADLEHIRQQQIDILLPGLQVMRDRAYDILLDQVGAGEGQKFVAGCAVGVAVLYRKPDKPKEIAPFFFQTMDHPVVVPAFSRGEIPESARDFATMGTMLVSRNQFGRANEWKKSSGLVQTSKGLKTGNDLYQAHGLEHGDLPGSVQIVFPKVLDSLMGWMQNSEGSIHGVRTWSGREATQLAVERSMLALARRSAISLPGIGLGEGA